MATAKKAVKKTATKKVVKKVVKLTAEESLKKFTRTAMLLNFVKVNNASWGHDEWVDFSEKVLAKYPAIDLDQVGVALEAKKAAFLAK